MALNFLLALIFWYPFRHYLLVNKFVFLHITLMGFLDDSSASNKALLQWYRQEIERLQKVVSDLTAENAHQRTIYHRQIEQTLAQHLQQTPKSTLVDVKRLLKDFRSAFGSQKNNSVPSSTATATVDSVCSKTLKPGSHTLHTSIRSQPCAPSPKDTQRLLGKLALHLKRGREIDRMNCSEKICEEKLEAEANVPSEHERPCYSYKKHRPMELLQRAVSLPRNTTTETQAPSYLFEALLASTASRSVSQVPSDFSSTAPHQGNSRRCGTVGRRVPTPSPTPCRRSVTPPTSHNRGSAPRELNVDA